RTGATSVMFEEVTPSLLSLHYRKLIGYLLCTSLNNILFLIIALFIQYYIVYRTALIVTRGKSPYITLLQVYAAAERSLSLALTIREIGLSLARGSGL